MGDDGPHIVGVDSWEGGGGGGDDWEPRRAADIWYRGRVAVLAASFKERIKADVQCWQEQEEERRISIRKKLAGPDPLKELEGETKVAEEKLTTALRALRKATEEGKGLVDSQARVVREEKRRRAAEAEIADLQASLKSVQDDVRNMEVEKIVAERALIDVKPELEVAKAEIAHLREQLASAVPRDKHEEELQAATSRATATSETEVGKLRVEVSRCKLQAVKAVQEKDRALAAAKEKLAQVVATNAGVCEQKDNLVRQWEGYANHWEKRGRKGEAALAQCQARLKEMDAKLAAKNAELKKLRGSGGDTGKSPPSTASVRTLSPRARLVTTTDSPVSAISGTTPKAPSSGSSPLVTPKGSSLRPPESSERKSSAGKR